MLYTLEEYLVLVRSDADLARSSDGGLPDKVSMAIALASASTAKVGVQHRPFLELFSDAEACNCLKVYVDVYGRAVSYIVSAWCDLGDGACEPSIWMAEDAACGSAFIVDSCFTEGSFSQTVALYLSCTNATNVTLYRPGRPKTYRTYGLPELLRRRWPTSYVHDRFAAENRCYVEEAIRSSLALFELTAKACTVMRLFEDEGVSQGLDISRSFPLVCSLINLDQIQIAGAEEETGCIAFALSNLDVWSTVDVGASLTMTLNDYSNGDDIIVLFGIGNHRAIFKLLISLLDRLVDEGEPDAVVPLPLFNEFEEMIRTQYERRGWRVSYVRINNFLRISRVEE
ncbi:hypothetical protein U1708_07665 [Sphingomonas sp. ZB1N12]|uniref:hypothetical protein n=1 Tax=Sphingomonas arabinosi TaxID=3096160 RepID=UPI002FCBBDA4